MYDVRKAQKGDIIEISAFISRLNKDSFKHAAYCGTDAEEIKNSLLTDIDDMPFEDCFAVVHRGMEILGVVGFDPDLQRGVGEIWGPFIETGYESALEPMWDKLMELLPEGIEELNLFINIQNSLIKDFAIDKGFQLESDEIVLESDRVSFRGLSDITLVELSQEHLLDFEILHNREFPNAYYSSKDILKRLGPNNKVYLCLEDNFMYGYVYIEVEPEFGEASIEFFAVKEPYRGLGKGIELIKIALAGIFSFAQIKKVTLCVSEENQRAISLYSKAGFKEKYRLQLYRKFL